MLSERVTFVRPIEAPRASVWKIVTSCLARAIALAGQSARRAFSSLRAGAPSTPRRLLLRVELRVLSWQTRRAYARRQRTWMLYRAQPKYSPLRAALIHAYDRDNRVYRGLLDRCRAIREERGVRDGTDV